MFCSPKQRITSESLQRVREYWNARENDSATALDPDVKSVTREVIMQNLGHLSFVKNAKYGQ